MTAPTLENGPYVFNVNNLFTETSEVNVARRMILELKNGLVNLGTANTIWTVVASSNGTTLKNIGDATPDTWSTISDLVYADPGTNHAWCVIKNLTTLGMLLIDYRSTSYLQCRVAYSHDGYNADGTLTDAPTATESATMWSQSLNFTTSDGNHRKFVMNCMCSADHKTTRWNIHQRNSVNGYLGGYAGFIEAAVNTPAIWSSTHKTVVIYYGSNYSEGSTTQDSSPVLTDFDGNRLRPYFETTEPYAAWLSAYASAECYNWLETNNGNFLAMNNVVQGLLGGYPVSPIGIFRSSATKGGSLGRLRDIYLAQPTHATHDTYPADASRTWVKWGCFIVPWNGTQPQDAV